MIILDYLPLFITVAFVHLVAAIVPAQDFVLISRQTLKNGRKAGIFCSLGITLGQAIHITYSMFGIAILITKYPDLLFGIKVLGGGYLVYLGTNGMFGRESNDIYDSCDPSRKNRSAILEGFLCNTFNPKSILYFISVFSVLIPSDTPLPVVALCGLIMMVIQMFWFSAIAIFFSNSRVYGALMFYRRKINLFFSLILILLGVSVMIS